MRILSDNFTPLQTADRGRAFVETTTTKHYKRMYTSRQAEEIVWYLLKDILKKGFE